MLKIDREGEESVDDGGKKSPWSRDQALLIHGAGRPRNKIAGKLMFLQTSKAGRLKAAMQAQVICPHTTVACSGKFN
jgi:hypothetical protein